jgi:hypothetical protein
VGGTGGSGFLLKLNILQVRTYAFCIMRIIGGGGG